MTTRDLESTSDTSAGSTRVVVAVLLFCGIALLMAVDILSDALAGGTWPHLTVEGGVMAMSLVGVGSLWQDLRTARGRVARLVSDLDVARREAAKFRADAREVLAGLGEAIDAQFARWRLTTAEREVGLLMLKGLSHREIAQARATSEATVRQQALGVYKKSGLRNRSELSAFFLEDLLLPREAAAE